MPRNYDLSDRTTSFGKEVVRFCNSIPKSVITVPLVSQLVRSGTSIGANYAEANGASSRNDFRHKIFICKKEAQETKHWFRMLSQCNPEKRDRLRKLWQEAQELTMIFQKITNSLRNKN